MVSKKYSLLSPIFFTFFALLFYILEPLTPLKAESLPSEEYAFYGKHFVASYLDCDPEAIQNVAMLKLVMDSAVESSKATILSKNDFVFPPSGLTAVYLLSESHASIHTYPEFNACFVDLFTCGEICSSENFDQILRAYLKPKNVCVRFFARDEEIREIPYP